MKAFLCSTVIFALLLGGAVFSSLFLQNTTDRLLALVEEFPIKSEDGESDPDPTLSRAEAFWEERRQLLDISANLRYSNNVTVALKSVIDYYENGSVSDYLVAKRQLIEALKTLRRSDTLRWESIV